MSEDSLVAAFSALVIIRDVCALRIATHSSILLTQPAAKYAMYPEGNHSNCMSTPCVITHLV
jgi:hypothetical protein